MVVAPPPPPEATPEEIAEARAQEFEEGDYQPTDKQVRFRATAEQCHFTGAGSLPPQWAKAHMEGVHRERVALPEFERWKKEKGFERWFYANIRWTPSDADKGVMMGTVWLQAQQGAARGEPRYLEILMDLMGLRKRAAPEEPKSVQEQIEEFRKRGEKGVEPSRATSGLRMNEE